MNFPVELDELIENPKARDENVDRDMYGLQPFYPLPADTKNAAPEFRSQNPQTSLETLDELLSRYRRLLSLIAYRVLCDHEQAELAVQSCTQVASYIAPKFENEGAFRSWLARVLIDEAVALLSNQRRSTGKSRDRDCRNLSEPAKQQRRKPSRSGNVTNDLSRERASHP